MISHDDVIVDKDSVTILGRRIPRPRSVGVSQWFEFWEQLKRIG